MSIDSSARIPSLGNSRFKPVTIRVVGDGVSLGNGLDVVVVVFLFDMKRAFVVFEDRSPSRARELTRNTQLVIVIFWLHPRLSAPSFPAASLTAAIVSSMSTFVVLKFVMHARSANFPFTVAFDRYARPPFCTVSMMRSFKWSNSYR